MKKEINGDMPCGAGTSEQFGYESAHKVALADPKMSLDLHQLQKLWQVGERMVVKRYVEKHYLGLAMQEWLMRTRDVELILAYLTHHLNFGLCESAEELLMALDNYELRKTYLDQWHLRQSSVLLLFAEKQFALLRRYVAKHPEESFSRTMLILMFEAGDKKLIEQYIKTHPSFLKDERYADKLRNAGFEVSVSTEI